VPITIDSFVCIIPEADEGRVWPFAPHLFRAVFQSGVSFTTQGDSDNCACLFHWRPADDCSNWCSIWTTRLFDYSDRLLNL